MSCKELRLRIAQFKRTERDEIDKEMIAQIDQDDTTGTELNAFMESLTSHEETPYLLAVLGMREQLIAGRDAPESECVADDGKW